MLQGFPTLVPPTIDHWDDWLIPNNDEEALLAQEEAELEEKWNEIRIANEGVNPLGKTTPENDHEDYGPDVEHEDADNVEEESEGEEFEQEAS